MTVAVGRQRIMVEAQYPLDRHLSLSVVRKTRAAGSHRTYLAVSEGLRSSRHIGCLLVGVFRSSVLEMFQSRLCPSLSIPSLL